MLSLSTETWYPPIWRARYFGWGGSVFFFSRSADIFQPFLETAEKTAGIFGKFQPLVGAAEGIET